MLNVERTQPATLSFFEKEVLRDSVEKYRGTGMPVVMTVPHDGRLSSLSQWELTKIEGAKPRDFAVSYLSKDIRKYTDATYFTQPSLLILKTHRDFITNQIRNNFSKEVVTTLNAYPISTNLLLDLHGFTKQPQIGEYDLILGTAHRKTVRGTMIDKHFEEFMTERGYAVYRPEEYRRDGELYAGENPYSLINQSYTHSPHTFGMQLEIARKFREQSELGRERGVKLAHDLGDYLKVWKEGLQKDTKNKKAPIIHLFVARNR